MLSLLHDQVSVGEIKVTDDITVDGGVTVTC